jgi:hypothetical protein
MSKEKLLRLAQKNPEIKSQIIEALKGAVANKRASASHTADSAAFAAWAKMSNPTGMSEKEVMEYLVAQGVTITPKGETAVARKTGKLEVGEIVHIDLSKCLEPRNKKNCELLARTPENQQFCMVVEIREPRDLTEMCTIVVSPLNTTTGKPVSKKFEFVAVYPKRIAKLTKDLEKAQAKNDQDKVQTILGQLRDKSLEPHNGHGIYRAGFKNLASYQTYLENLSNEDVSEEFIIVYDRAGDLPTPAFRKQFVEKANKDRTRQTLLEGKFDDLVEGGLASYANVYYEGEIGKAGFAKKDGTMYFMLNAGGAGYTSISPAKGKVFFIAKASEMPSEAEWTQDLRQRMAAVVESHIGELLK